MSRQQCTCFLSTFTEISSPQCMHASSIWGEFVLLLLLSTCAVSEITQKDYIRSCIALVKFSSCLRLKSFRIGWMKSRPLPITLFSSLGDWAMAADMGSKHVFRPCGWHLSSINPPQSSSLGKVAIIAGLKSWGEHDMSSMVTFFSPRPASTSISFSAEDNGTLVSAKLL